MPARPAKQGDDRRRFPRARFGWRAAIGRREDDELVAATTHDISMGGACVRGALPAVPGDEVVLLFSMKERTVPARATVVRSEIIGAGEVQLHVEFDWFAESGRQQLAKLTRAMESGADESRL